MADPIALQLEGFTFNDAQVGRIVQQLRNGRHAEVNRLRTRRLLMEMTPPEGEVDEDNTGTAVPDPFDESDLILQTMIAEPVKAVQFYASRIGANQPQSEIQPLSRDGRLTQKVDETAAEQERLQHALWDLAQGRKKQRRAAWAQSWGRGAWYFTLPLDAAWGLPSRRYYDPSDDEFDELQRSGELSPIELPNPSTGNLAFAESSDVWRERRKDAMRGRAVAGRSLFYLETFGPDVVFGRWDRADDELKYAAIVQEIPAEDFGPDTELARLAGEAGGVNAEDLSRFGLFADKDGSIIGGIAAGTAGASDAAGRREGLWTLSIFVTRTEVYYHVIPGITGAPKGSASQRVAATTDGTIIWAARHGAMINGEPACPLVPIPCMETETPGRWTTPVEQVFSLTPLINQIETLLSLGASFNGIPRWFFILPDGTVLRDPETGRPVINNDAVVPGLNPAEAVAMAAEPRQLTIDVTSLLVLLDTYREQMADYMPSPAATGDAGSSGPAWSLRQLIEQQSDTLKEPVDHHAAAVQRVMWMWNSWMRTLDVPIMVYTVPGQRGSERSARGLIEFDPADLTDSFVIRQQTISASDRIVSEQQGLELRAAGVIDDERLFAEHFNDPDPRSRVIDNYLQRLRDGIIVGDPNAVPPGSVLHTVMLAVLERLPLELAASSPLIADALARQMAATTEAQQTVTQQTGNVAEAAGIRQAGVGASTTLPGTAESGAGGSPRPSAPSTAGARA